ncbi:MAG: L-glutamate gamma-semialdehyde dehydrogenase [Planctomycetota bacterium]
MYSKPTVPTPMNEPVLSYAPGTPERTLLKEELNRQFSECLDIPLIIGGKEIRTGNTAKAVCPHDHQHVLATYHLAGPEEIHQAVQAAQEAKAAWEAMAWTDRVAIFLKMAELITVKYRYVLNAATMLNQSKNPFQAEIDSACEYADFLRFNAKYMEKIYTDQPESPPGVWNRINYRPLEGFVLAVSPFNFTSIAGNLSAAPAMMGNTVIWKPASSSILSGFYLMKLFEEAGIPAGVINFLPAKGSEIGEIVLKHPDLGGVHFTGSTRVFQQMWKTVGENIANYKSYPRIVGETGGKDFIFAHKSADLRALAVGLVRGAFEYQGQKCSACSRAYIPASLWEKLLPELRELTAQVTMGDVTDFTNLFNAVINEASFDKTMAYIEGARASDDAEVIIGGNGDKSKGYFVEPTMILARDPKYVTMQEEIFAPVLTLYVYEDELFHETLTLCNETSPYALTGAIFAQDRTILPVMARALRHAAGNFYVNDKPTGAVVGQQPFGGSRASGTNDKAGSYLNLLRWVSPQTLKETFVPPREVPYPFAQPE